MFPKLVQRKAKGERKFALANFNSLSETEKGIQKLKKTIEADLLMEPSWCPSTALTVSRTSGPSGPSEPSEPASQAELSRDKFSFAFNECGKFRLIWEQVRKPC